MSEQSKLNILVAYPYLKPDVIRVISENKNDIRFLLDSGAFTAWKAGKPIQLDDYCRFIESLPFEPWRYFTLDVIGDPHASMKNYEIMLKRGFKPIPIFTRGEEPSVLEDYYKTSDVVGIGGLVRTPGNKGFVKGIMKKVNGRRVHWLGFTNLNFILHFKPYSVDSSSFDSGLRFGYLNLFYQNETVTITKKEFAKRLSQKKQDVLNSYREKWDKLKISSEWTNSGCDLTTFEHLLYKSSIRFSRQFHKKTDTLMFYACVGGAKIKCLLKYKDFT